MESTGTFKQRKVDFVKEGFDPTVIADKLWYYSSSSKKYEVLDAPAYQQIVGGTSRL
jgi:fatty-acyl-CoA synthase